MDQKTSTNTEGSPLSLKEMPILPLRAGRHLTAWILWHTARVSIEHGHLTHGHSDATLPPAKRPG
jgi:hypothetical protein